MVRKNLKRKPRDTQVFLFRFTAEKLRLVPPQHLGFLLASGHCCNELAVLLPYILFEQTLARTNESEGAFILARRFTIDRILVSKIVEYGELCTKFFGEADPKSDLLLGEWSDAYQPIAKQLKAAKWARILRNKISFHYDSQYALEALKKLDGGHPLMMVAGRIKGLTLFDFAEEIVARPIFEQAGDGNVGSGIEVATRFIVKLVGEITAFHARATIAAFHHHGMISTREESSIRAKYTAAPSGVRVPITLSADYIDGRARRVR